MTDNQTSHEAYEFIKEDLPEMHERILDFIIDQGGATCLDIEKQMGLLHQTASACLTRLRRYDGSIFCSGFKRQGENNRKYNFYEVVHGRIDAKKADPKCGDQGMKTLTEDMVVRFLVNCSEDRLHAIITETRLRREGFSAVMLS